MPSWDEIETSLDSVYGSTHFSNRASVRLWESKKDFESSRTLRSTFGELILSGVIPAMVLGGIAGASSNDAAGWIVATIYFCGFQIRARLEAFHLCRLYWNSMQNIEVLAALKAHSLGGSKSLDDR